MPAMSGDELASLIKESAAPIPVIMITGFGVLMKSAGEHLRIYELH
jgi:FixJ family two-component response regulator